MRRADICVSMMNKCSGYSAKHTAVSGNVYQKYLHHLYAAFAITGVDYSIPGQQLLRPKTIQPTC